MAKNAQGLVDYAKAQVGLPYWFGCFGQTASEALYKNKKKQYPKYYLATDFSKQYGKRVHDCAGLIKGYLMSTSATAAPVYNSSLDLSADGFYNSCTEKGSISTIPEIAGVIVWKKDHIGVYIGNDRVVEALGHAYGVIESNIKERGWTNWGKLKYVDYSSAEELTSYLDDKVGVKKVNVQINALQYGSRGNAVKTLQILLNAKGYTGSDGKKLAEDGSFGDNTAYAVRKYQTDKKLTPIDGYVGQGTWNSLINL